MALQPRFFIVRLDGKRSVTDGKDDNLPGPIVPLIAVDELPKWLDLVGVPRELAVEQTVGLYNLGAASKSKGTYGVKINHQATPAHSSLLSAVDATRHKLDGDTTSTDLSHTVRTTHLSAAPSSESKTLTYSTTHPADRMKAHWSEAHARAAGLVIQSSDYSASSSQQRSNNLAAPLAEQQCHPLPFQASPSASPPAISPPKANTNSSANPSPSTEYCRYWCHHGTCKWGPHCRHQHVMPATAAGLAEVGLRGLPGWWVALQYHYHSGQRNNQSGNISASVPSLQNKITGQGPSSGNRTVRVSHSASEARDARYSGPTASAATTMPMGAATSVPTERGGGDSAGYYAEKKKKKNKKAVTKAQLRETVALLRQLGLVRGAGGKTGSHKREVNPLEKRKGRMVVGEGKEALLVAAPTEGGVAAGVHSSPAGTVVGGQAHSEAAVAPRMDGGAGETGEDGCVEQAAVLADQTVDVGRVGKLVDV